MLNQNNIRNVNAYIYTVLKNQRYALNKREFLEKRLNAKYSKIETKEEFHSNVEFFDLLTDFNKKDQKILILRYINTLTIREIAQVINMKKSTVEYRLKRAHKLLANRL